MMVPYTMLLYSFSPLPIPCSKTGIEYTCSFPQVGIKPFTHFGLELFWVILHRLSGSPKPALSAMWFSPGLFRGDAAMPQSRLHKPPTHAFPLNLLPPALWNVPLRDSSLPPAFTHKRMCVISMAPHSLAGGCCCESGPISADST